MGRVNFCVRDINNGRSGVKYFTFESVYNIISMYTMCLWKMVKMQKITQTMDKVSLQEYM